jgi:hypothetical protein
LIFKSLCFQIEVSNNADSGKGDEDDDEDDEEAADMEEFEESGLLDEQDKVMHIMGFNLFIILKWMYRNVISTDSLHMWLISVVNGGK